MHETLLKKDNLKARQTLQRIADSRTTFGVAPSLRYAEPPIGKYFMKCSSRHCNYISNTKSMRLLILEKENACKKFLSAGPSSFDEGCGLVWAKDITNFQDYFNELV